VPDSVEHCTGSASSTIPTPDVLNDLLASWNLSGVKPLVTALLLPPVPLLALMLAGAGLARRRPALGWTALSVGAAAIWLTCTTAVGAALERRLVQPPLDRARIQQLARDGPAGTAIVVLGAGREGHSPEYGGASLPRKAIERLRYGLWLSRETGIAVAFSGGIGHAQGDGPAEAEIAARIAARDFGRPLKWVETESRDTRENAIRSVALLRAAGIQRIVLVTHGWHMRRSLQEFERAIERQHALITVIPAPVGLAGDDSRSLLRWLPSGEGFLLTRDSLREWLALLASV
jgi:uncharacterized SAM-binding protein YcdF (DUF218 family)